MREVRKVVAGFGCQKCFGSTTAATRMAATRPDLVEEWHPTKNGARTPHNTRANADYTAWWLGACGHEWRALMGNRVRGYGCPYCGFKLLLPGFNDLSTVAPELAREFSPANGVEAGEVLCAGGRWLWDCSTCGHSWRTSITSRSKKGSGCPRCAKAELAETLRGHSIQRSGTLAEVYPELAREWSPRNELTPETVSATSGYGVEWSCGGCGHAWTAQIAKRSSGGGRCPVCFPRGLLEDSIADAVEELSGLAPRRGARDVLLRLELDIYLPEESFAVEVNGDYWHSNAFMRSSKGLSAQAYHEKKFRAAEAAGVRLFFVWEHQWREQHSEVREAIAAALSGETPPLLRLLALPPEREALFTKRAPR